MRQLGFAFLLAGCASFSEAPQSASWIVGRWCPDGRSVYAGHVIGLRPVEFHADGTYSTFEEDGRWKLSGARLERITTGGFRFQSVDRIERIGRDEVVWTMEHGQREVWHRCGEKP